MKKILFSDLDGTIISRDHALHKHNLEALKELQRQGHLVALCTGRNNIDILPTLKQIAIPYDYLVLCNGAYIVDKDGQIIYEKDIEQMSGREMLEEFSKEDRLVTYFCDGEYCVMKNSQGTRLLDKNGDIHDTKGYEVYYQHLQNAKHFTIIGINQEDEKTDFLDGYVKNTMPKYDGKISWFYNTAYIDIMAPESSKGLGMMRLAKYLGFEEEQVYAIGDSYNDVSMISMAGHGYTFNRSEEDVKKQADHLVDYLYEVVNDILEKKIFM